jgi:hypothetical protein
MTNRAGVVTVWSPFPHLSVKLSDVAVRAVDS